jgi:hypothetical protein
MKMEVTCSSETSVDLNGLYGNISQKIELFESERLVAMIKPSFEIKLQRVYKLILVSAILVRWVVIVQW